MLFSRISVFSRIVLMIALRFSFSNFVLSDTSSQTHKTGSTDNILIIQSVSNGQETLQISNVRNTPLMGTTDDIIVEAKYTHPQEGEGRKSSELLLQNIPSQFESTFVEPDDSTTEIVVDKDGSKNHLKKDYTANTIYWPM